MPLIHPAKGGGHLIAGDDQDKLFVLCFLGLKKLLICDIIVCIRRQLVCGLFFYKTTGAHN